MSDKNMADVADKIVDKVDALAQAMAKVAPDAWETMVRAERIAGVTRAVMWVLFAVLTYAVYRVARWSWSKCDDWPWYDDAGAFFSTLFTVCMTVFCVVALFAAGDDVARQLLVPEYVAGMRLLEVVR